MWISSSVDELARVRDTSRQTSVAIGVFDGVHLGHRALLQQTLATRPAGGDAVVCTFYPHPKHILRPEEAPPAIASLSTRLSLLADAGLNGALVFPFDNQAATQTPRSFVEQVLVHGLNARHVIVGEGFVFGAKRSGTIDVLRELGEQHGFEVHAHPPVRLDDTLVSSTRIRHALLAGDVLHARRALGAPYRVRGPVVQGDQRGRTLGFPTANVAADVPCLLPWGVYAAHAQLPGGERIPAAVSVGVHPTFEAAKQMKIEAFLLDFAWRELYGVEMTLHVQARIREERRFDSAAALVTQMHEDVRATREALRAS